MEDFLNGIMTDSAMYDGCENNKCDYIKNANEEFYNSFALLNEYQKKAVVDESRALLLNASVGSGKTRVLVQKVLYLYHVRKVPLSEMVVFTFTNKAAEEIKERIVISGSINNNKKDLNLFGTFHSVARYLLSSVLPVEEMGYTKEFSVIDQDSLNELYENVINSNSLNVKYRKKIQKRLENLRTGKTLYGNMKHEDEIDKFFAMVSKEKLQRNVMDFDDLISVSSKLLKCGYFRPKWIIIDEFQDTDETQLRMIDGMMGEDTHVFAVGDPNQIIYTWRGSSAHIFKDFRERYGAEEKTLPVNYRSTGVILDAAKVFLDDPSNLKGNRERGSSIIVKRHYNTFNEALYLAEIIRNLHEKEEVPYKEIAIFYRKQKQSTVFQDVFSREGIPYEISVRKTLKDIPVLYFFVRVLKTALNCRDFDSLLYVLMDGRYGQSMTLKQASFVVKNIKSCEGNSLPLINKILTFNEWCQELKSPERLEDTLYDFFDVDSFISPTSITYDEDKSFVKKYICQIKGYIAIYNMSVYDGIKKFMDDTSLYGSQVINEIADPEKESVKLMTLHAAKGLEFKYVFISGANYGNLPIGGRLDDEEEKRLFFVGITRAKDHLEISYHTNPDDFNVLSSPSPFIRMIPDELIESDELKSRAAKLTDLRREVRDRKDRGNDAAAVKIVKKVLHAKYGEGYVTDESEDYIKVEFQGYGEKSFSKMFCPLKFID